MVGVHNLTVEFGSVPLFEGINFVLNKKDKIALVGKNGAGKSTLLKIISGLQSPTSGSVSVPDGITIGYLPQQMILADTKTVKEEAEEVFSHVKELKTQIDKINAELLNRTDYESAEYNDLIEQVSSLNDTLDLFNTDNFEAEIEKTLIGLGFEHRDFNRPTSEFSGGWRMRIELAKILLRRPDVLLLDEPTNHLDIESIQWLENFLKNKAKAIILVSHDRAFIDNVTNRTIEISLGRIYDYDVNYSKFVELRKERIEQQTRAFQNQQKQIQDTEAFIERFRYKATKSVQVQSRIKQLSKIERIEVEQIDNSHISLKFPPAPRSGDYPIIADGLEKTYGEHTVYSDVTFTLKRGEKVAFVGKNGAGKSTLVKCIMQEIPYGGVLKIGHNVKIGYFAQNQAQLLDENLSIFDTIDRVAVGDIRTRINDILGAFMFGGEISEKKVKVLSGGEKTRLAMIKLLLEPVNLLILDEPTNHLDMRTKDILKEAISAFDGTVVLVSHDRDFLNGLVDKVYEFANGSVKEYLGGIYDFLEKKKIDNLQELERIEPSSKQNNNIADKQISASKESYLEKKEKDRLLRSVKRKIEQIEDSISKLEDEIEKIEEKMGLGDVSDVTIYDRHQELNKSLEQEMQKWEEASNELENLNTL